MWIVDLRRSSGEGRRDAGLRFEERLYDFRGEILREQRVVEISVNFTVRRGFGDFRNRTIR